MGMGMESSDELLEEVGVGMICSDVGCSLKTTLHKLECPALLLLFPAHAHPSPFQTKPPQLISDYPQAYHKG